MTGKDIRIVFMGTPDFAVASLRELFENDYNIVGVITAPDKPAGRGRHFHESAVKRYAVQKGLYVLQPEKLKNPDFINELESLKADLQIVVAFRMLPEVVWKMPRLGTFNLHASLLPQYRGAAPLNWAIINGEKETGVTTFLLSHEIDTGAILFSERIQIGENDNVGDVHDKLMDIGANLVVKTVEALAAGNYNIKDQDELAAGESLKLAPKIFKSDCRIDWTKTTDEIRNLIRGLSPYPAAWTEIVDENGNISSLKIYAADKVSGSITAPGTIGSDGKNYIKIATANGWLLVKDLQLAGKKRMKTEELLRGFHGIDKCTLKNL